MFCELFFFLNENTSVYILILITLKGLKCFQDFVPYPLLFRLETLFSAHQLLTVRCASTLSAFSKCSNNKLSRTVCLYGEVNRRLSKHTRKFRQKLFCFNCL